jgi:iron complex transport system ATP-binding protein
MTSRAALLDLQNIGVMRGNKIVLDDFTLRVNCNEHIAILGPNGCGKSTLIKTITRECYPLVRPDSRMRIMGQEMWNVFDLRCNLGIVSNDLMSMCTGEASGVEVVLSGFFSSNSVYSNHSVDHEKRQAAHEAMERLGVSHLADRPVCEMSSGEAKRILIARALVHRPLALLFDEPCNSLDMAAQHSLRQTMRSLANEGIGIILVTHELPDIIPEIERVILMSKGKIIADGVKENVLQSAALSRLFGMHLELVRRDGFYHVG